ncbi:MULTISPECIES: pyridoxal phosphate-dependent aminotransferase [Pontibacter]|uniref:2-keto-4-methylthiobutyrate aminotransferase apoenzyme n=1 Tax=Pontibacter lucknowensis TaxID=1077936 RepID=A0A1N6U6N9_9BACT|nr:MULTISPECIES: pyridoxal phosphate-dependent aminotransferase [Pontibacter]EJF11523.1 methionine aminotransferase [Pontibacter sp. BAB1700]SIQ61264.1 2-keto-4-methylthiobutyrate aminotransferase apoenzyme [Pontibacter lucknowensis]
MINYPGSKLPDVGTSIFAVMSALANEHGAINLSQGFPDFNCPDELIALVTKYMQEGYNQYAPMPGMPALRHKISEKTEKVYGYRPDPDQEVTVTSGATEALFAAITAVVKSGDEVVVLEPCYDSYAPAIRLAGGIPIYVPLALPDFSIDWELLKKNISRRTRMIIINTPHNPTGAVIPREDLEKLANLTDGTDILIMSDEVYEHMVFDGKEHVSALQIESLRQRSFVISSFGKTYHTTGWKIGYVVAPPALTAELRKMHQFITFCSVTPLQLAIADYMDNEEHYRSLPDFYQAKRDLFCELVKPSRFELIPSAGTYFQLLKYDAISQEHDLDFAKRLTQEIGVASVPVSAFYHNKTDHHYLRFCFAKSEETLRQAAEKLVKL